MYSFIAYFQNFVTGEETGRRIDIDMRGCDCEMLEGKSELLVAWECAIRKALKMRRYDIDFCKIELICC